jgi:hypothetical protein
LKKKDTVKHEYVVFILTCRCNQEMELRAWSDKEWNVQCMKCGKRHHGVGRIERR